MATLWVITSVLWFAIGYNHALGMHHRYMTRGWTHLQNVAKTRAVQQQDEFDAFPHKSWWRP